MTPEARDDSMLWCLTVLVAIHSGKAQAVAIKLADALVIAHNERFPHGKVS